VNIFITGIAGFIASNLAEILVEKNTIIGIENFDPFYDRVTKDRNLTALRQQSNNFIFYENDILDTSALDTIFSNHKIDFIVHLAAKAGVRPSIKDPGGYNKVNIGGTINILQAAKKHNVENIIFASSSSIYGNNKKVPFSETDNVDYTISPYAASKKSCELICHTYYHLFSMKIAALRFFTVYGRRQRPDLAIAKFTRLINSGQSIPFYGDGTTQRDYTYIDDILDGMTKCIKWLTEQPDKTFEIFNLGGNKTVTLSELVSLIEEALGKKAIIAKEPMQPGDVMRTYADITKANETFGYNPTTHIKDGIKKYIDYYNREYALLK